MVKDNRKNKLKNNQFRRPIGERKKNIWFIHFLLEPIYAIFYKDSWKNNVIKIDEVHRKTDKSRTVCTSHLFSLQRMVDTEGGKREHEIPCSWKGTESLGS